MFLSKIIPQAAKRCFQNQQSKTSFRFTAAISRVNYIVFGQNNKNENNSAEIIRIVKYSKNWSRISDCKIYGSNTTAPFNAGSLRMIELDGKLYVYTCHEMYADSNNLNHQANMLFTVDESTMKTTDSMYEVSNLQNGYVSHSFNQFIATDGAYIYRVDHSESNISPSTELRSQNTAKAHHRQMSPLPFP